MEIDVLGALEKVKRAGHYAVQMTYGEGVGCDDLDVNALDRHVLVWAVPVGCLGEARRVWIGKVSEMNEMGNPADSKVLPNPPGKLPEETGWYMWGTENAIEAINKKDKK